MSALKFFSENPLVTFIIDYPSKVTFFNMSRKEDDNLIALSKDYDYLFISSLVNINNDNTHISFIHGWLLLLIL